MIDVAEQYGAGEWKGNVAYLFANTGAFVTAAGLQPLPGPEEPLAGRVGATPRRRATAGAWRSNYLLAMLTGTLWYAQFFFYNLGHVRMGRYAFTSWAIHMIMLVLFSNLLAVLFREWKGCRPRTHWAISLALTVLVAAILLLTYGNYLGDRRSRRQTSEFLQNTEGSVP